MNRTVKELEGFSQPTRQDVHPPAAHARSHTEFWTVTFSKGRIRFRYGFQHPPCASPQLPILLSAHWVRVFLEQEGFQVSGSVLSHTCKQGTLTLNSCPLPQGGVVWGTVSPKKAPVPVFGDRACGKANEVRSEVWTYKPVGLTSLKRRRDTRETSPCLQAHEGKAT